MIQTAPESDRAALVAAALEFFRVDTGKLTREQQFQLAVKQIEAKARQVFITAVVVGIVAVAALAVLLVALLRTDTPSQPPPAPQGQLDEIDLADVDFLDYPDDSRAPRLDLKLRNIGVRSAFVKKVKINVKKTWRLVDLPQATGVVVPPEHNYVAKVRPVQAPYQVVVPVSQGMRPDDLGRFTVQLEEDPWPDSNTIYLTDVEIVSNGNDSTYHSKDLLFYITQRGTTFPDSAALQEIARAEKSRGNNPDLPMLRKAASENKATILGVLKLDAVRNPALERLIETAEKSDIQ